MTNRITDEVDLFRSTILARHIEAEEAFVNGDPQPRMELWSKRDPVTLFGAIGMSESGWEALSHTFGWVATRFSKVSDFRIEVELVEVSGDLAYVLWFERFEGSIAGRPVEPVTVRVTHAYRREEGEWKIVHRHADNPPASPAGANRNESTHVQLEETMSETSAMPVVRRPEEGRSVPNPIADDVIIKLTQGETGGALSMFESTPGPGAGPPMHVHANEDEVMYVVEGTIRFQLGDEMQETPAGGFAFIPRGLRHAWQNIGSEPARVMFFLTPASTGMERFFPAFAEVPEDGPVQEEFARLASEAGMEVVGPPLARFHPAPSVRG
jgi:quercetin dioxygenase-like cupin family protein/ketosteroid isomerase-like protein